MHQVRPPLHGSVLCPLALQSIFTPTSRYACISAAETIDSYTILRYSCDTCNELMTCDVFVNKKIT